MSTHKPVFSGAERPNTTQVPNVYFDHFLADLSGNEFKLLMYLSRRIFGFHKESDNISLSQMLNGIRKRNGEYLDRGTGLSKPTLLRALRELQDKGLVVAEQRRDPIRGDVATNYRLRIFRPDQTLIPGGKNLNQGEELEGDSNFYQGEVEIFSTPVVKNHDTQNKHVQNKVNSIHHHVATTTKQGDDARISSRKTTKTIALHQPTRSVSKQVTKATARGEKSLPDPALIARLVGAGVSQRQAEKLVRVHPGDRIEAALGSLPFRNAKNPAGYLVREIEDGGWLPPVAIQEQEKKSASAARRKAAEEKTAKLEAERTRATEDRFHQVEQLVEQLAPELVAELWSEARSQVTKYSRLATTADEQSPFLKAAFHNLIQDRFLSQ